MPPVIVEELLELMDRYRIPSDRRELTLNNLIWIDRRTSVDRMRVLVRYLIRWLTEKERSNQQQLVLF